MFKKWSFVNLSFFLYSFKGLAQDCLDLSSLFEYKSIPFSSVQCSGTLISHYLDIYVIMGMYGTLTTLGVSDTPFCDIMRMLRMCCHGEVM